MNVLIACECSQLTVAAFRKKGHNAFSCDLLNGEINAAWHIKGDVLQILNPEFYESDLYFGIRFLTQDMTPHQVPKWDLIIAHPPCTYLTKASACRLYPKAGIIDPIRFEKGIAARDFFLKIWDCNCDKIAIENPTPLKCFNLPPYSQVVQPFQFKHPYSKRTLLWLKNLPQLIPTGIMKDYTPYIASNTSNHAKGRGGSLGVAKSAKDRSRSFKGISEAMADQWGQDTSNERSRV